MGEFMNYESNQETGIIYHGHSMFEIRSVNGIKIITDPYNERIRDRLPDVSADIVLVSHDHFDHGNVSSVRGNPTVVKSPGVTELKGIYISGIESYHDTRKGELRGKNLIFRFIVDGVVFAHLGDLGHNLDAVYLEKLKDVDILMIPVGGTYTVNFLEASDITEKIKPRIVIPMHYRETDSKLDVDTVNPFLSRWQNIEKKGHSASVSKEGIAGTKGTEVWLFDSR
jgi:L-ascorbate metabolism protein UlaG (beta-lactamase superfamily)